MRCKTALVRRRLAPARELPARRPAHQAAAFYSAFRKSRISSHKCVKFLGRDRREEAVWLTVLITCDKWNYRYYTCAAARLKGKTACKAPTSIPDVHLDQLVLGALADQLLTLERLVILLREAIRRRRSLAANHTTQRTALRSNLKSTEAQIERLLAAVTEGTTPDMALLRTKMREWNGQRNKCARHLQILDTDLPELRQTLSKQQAATVAATLKRRLLDALRALQRRYVRGLVSEIVVD